MPEFINNNKKCICDGNNKNCICMYENCNKCKSCNMLIINEFDAFMNSRRKYTDDGKILTHTSMGSVRGAWCIPVEDYSQFMKLYINFSRKNISSYVERSPWNAPFYFDIDFHTKKKNRYYDNEFIKETIKRLNRIIGEHFAIPENSTILHSYVFEKYEPSEHNNGGFKDGFHIMYPELALSVQSRYYIYDKFRQF